MKRICDLRGYEKVKPCYYVAGNGEIVSYSNKHGGSKETCIQLKPSVKKGYSYVTLVSNDGKLTFHRVHRIVAAAFVENESGGHLVHHKDGNKSNNSACNLEWITPREHSRITNSKPLYCYSKNGEPIKAYEYAAMARDDGFNLSHACNVARGIEKTHKGLYFSFVPLSKEDVLQRLSKSYPASGRRK